MPDPSQCSRVQRWHVDLIAFIEGFRGRVADDALACVLDLASHNENELALEYLARAVEDIHDALSAEERARHVGLLDGFVAPHNLPPRYAGLAPQSGR